MSIAVPLKAAPKAAVEPEQLSLKDKIRLEKERKRMEEEKNLTFQPRLHPRMGMNNNGGLVEDNSMSRFDKLYVDAMKRQKTIAKLSNDGKGEERGRSATRPSTGIAATPIAGKRPPCSSSFARSSSVGKTTKFQELSNSLCASIGKISSKTIKTMEDSQPSFKPQITKKAMSVEATEGGPERRGDFLHRMHLLHLKKLNALKQRVDSDIDKECTFMPHVNKTPSSNTGGVVSTIASTLDLPERMRKYEERKTSKLERLKRDSEMQQEKELTFKPEIHELASISNKIVSDKNVFDRLSIMPTGDAEDKCIDLEMTFRPRLRVNPDTIIKLKLSDKPLHERLHEEAAMIKAKLEKKRVESLEEEGKVLTFHPVVSAAAAATSSGREDLSATISVFERLNTSRQYTQNMLTQIKSELELAECSFQPAIASTSTERLLTNTSNTTSSHSSADNNIVGGSIHERLFNESSAILEKKEELRKSIEAKIRPFQPSIPQPGEGVMLSRSMVTGLSIHERLNKEFEKIRGRKEELEEQKQKNELSECTFKPVIRTTGMAPNISYKTTNMTIHERLNADSEKKRNDLSRREQEKAASEMAGSTFKPAINSTSEAIVRVKKSKKAELAEDITF